MDANLRTHAATIISLCILVAGGLAIVTAGSIPPSDFPAGNIILIPKDASLSSIADILAVDHVIRSPFLYKAFVVLLGGRNRVGAGDYYFAAPESALRVAYRTANGEQDLPRIKVTIPEGLNSSEIAALLFKDIPGFDAPTFLALAKPHEGYLFPDTYFFTIDTTPQEAVNEMRATFDLEVPASVAASSSLPDIIKMASIVEKEATSTADRRIIAGILWKRLAAGIPLQVDVSFYYLLGKTSAQLTAADLAVDSPYNLYTHAGLPPTPLDNPGLDAIMDTVTPTATNYWYYLSDSNGAMHYSTTLAEHNANKAKYVE